MNWQRHLVAIYQWLVYRVDSLCRKSGRINRLHLLVRVLSVSALTAAFSLVIMAATGQGGGIPSWPAILLARLEVALLLAGALWILVASVVRRLHDIGQSGRYWFLGLLFLPVLLLWPGSADRNRYGFKPPPLMQLMPWPAGWGTGDKPLKRQKNG